MAQRLGEGVTMRSCGQVGDLLQAPIGFMSQKGEGWKWSWRYRFHRGRVAARLSLKGVTTFLFNALKKYGKED